MHTGTVSHGTMRPQDLIPSFLDVLAEVAPAEYQQMMIPGCGFPAVPSYALEDDDSEWWDSDAASWILECLFDALNDHAPDGHYFGAHEGDGSDYGFWAILED